MYSGEMRTALLLRRMKRKSFSIFTWSAYSPTKARPEELKFELLDGNERRIGEFAYTTFNFKLMAPINVAIMTPWGEAAIDYHESTPRISLNGRELASIGSSLLKRGFDLTFPGGRTLKFSHLKGGRNDIQYSDGSGRIDGIEENGVIPEGMTGRSLQLTPEEIKALPKADRPRSIETREYKQFRISTSGTFPVNEEEIVRALAIFASFGMLMEEIPS